MRLVAALVFSLALSACGFQLRGQQTLPFDSIAVPSTTVLGAQLGRSIAAGTNAKVVQNPKEAEATFLLLGEYQEKVILSLNTQGRVREYQLRYRVAYQVTDGKGQSIVEPQQIVLTRDITFNDQVLAKENEEALLYRDMRSDMVQQIMRRIAAAKPLPPPEE